MIRRCRDAGLPEPEFAVTDGCQIVLRRALATTRKRPKSSAGEVAGEVVRLLAAVQEEMSRQVLQRRLALKGEANFRRLYLEPALEAGLIEMTRPDKPQSRLQKYRLTDKGRATLAALCKTL